MSICAQLQLDAPSTPARYRVTQTCGCQFIFGHISVDTLVKLTYGPQEVGCGVTSIIGSGDSTDVLNLAPTMDSEVVTATKLKSIHHHVFR